MNPRTLSILAGAAVVAMLALLTWALLDQRATNRNLVRKVDALIAESDRQSAERVQAVKHVLRQQERAARTHRRQTERDLEKVIGSLRVILREMGGQGSDIPPQSQRQLEFSSPSESETPGKSDPPGKAKGHSRDKSETCFLEVFCS